MIKKIYFFKVMLLLAFFVFFGMGNVQAAGSRECGSEVILVLDQSGSISPDIDDVISTASAFIDKLMQTESFGIRAGVVWYSDSAVLSQSLTYNKDAVKAALNPPLARNGTNMAAAIQTADAELVANGEFGIPKVIVHLTDGSANNEAAAAAAFTAAKGHGIRVINIGLSFGIHDSFLATNASQNCPSAAYSPPSCFWKAPTTADLDNIYNSILVLLGDKDSDGYRGKTCGGDDCDDNAPGIYPGQPCYDQCFGRVLKGGICQAGTGLCKYDTEKSKCEGLGDECKIDVCSDRKNADDYCLLDAGMNVCGGIVPCGRLADDPRTPENEKVPCEFCHIVFLINIAMNFLISLVGIVSVLAILVTGFMFITSAGDVQRKNKAKTAFKWVLLGFVIIFLAWLVIDFMFIVWGFLDPLGGKWSVVCE